MCYTKKCDWFIFYNAQYLTRMRKQAGIHPLGVQITNVNKTFFFPYPYLSHDIFLCLESLLNDDAAIINLTIY